MGADARESGAEVGGRVATGPYDTPIGCQAILADPAGATFSVSTAPGRA